MSGRQQEVFKRGELKKHYFEVINKYRLRPPKSGELHHIIPRSLGGSNDISSNFRSDTKEIRSDITFQVDNWSMV